MLFQDGTQGERKVVLITCNILIFRLRGCNSADIFKMSGELYLHFNLNYFTYKLFYFYFVKNSF